MRGVRPRRGFRVILDAEQRHIPVAQSLQRLFVQVPVRELNFALRQRIGIDGEVVVVSRYFDLSSLQIFDRMVPAVVAELEFEGLASQRDSCQLMPQADSKNRLAT